MTEDSQKQIVHAASCFFLLIGFSAACVNHSGMVRDAMVLDRSCREFLRIASKHRTLLESAGFEIGEMVRTIYGFYPTKSAKGSTARSFPQEFISSFPELVCA